MMTDGRLMMYSIPVNEQLIITITPSKRTPISPQPRTSFDIDGIADAVHRKHMHTG